MSSLKELKLFTLVNFAQCGNKIKGFLKNTRIRFIYTRVINMKNI